MMEHCYNVLLIYVRWAMQEGYGAKLIKTPELIKDIVRQTVSRVPGLPVSIKIRIHDDSRYSVQLFFILIIKSFLMFYFTAYTF